MNRNNRVYHILNRFTTDMHLGSGAYGTGSIIKCTIFN
jgi:hypothetical protein